MTKTPASKPTLPDSGFRPGTPQPLSLKALYGTCSAEARDAFAAVKALDSNPATDINARTEAMMTLRIAAAVAFEAAACAELGMDTMAAPDAATAKRMLLGHELGDSRIYDRDLDHELATLGLRF